MNDIQKREDALFEHISKLIEKSRKQAKTAINTAMVYTYYGIGKYIVEDEQNGYERAAYGKKVLKQLSEQLCAEYGNGWTVDTLKRCRFFYKAYSPYQIGATPLPQLNEVLIGFTCIRNIPFVPIVRLITFEMHATGIRCKSTKK